MLSSSRSITIISSGDSNFFSSSGWKNGKTCLYYGKKILESLSSKSMTVEKKLTIKYCNRNFISKLSLRDYSHCNWHVKPVILISSPCGGFWWPTACENQICLMNGKFLIHLQCFSSSLSGQWTCKRLSERLTMVRLEQPRNFNVTWCWCLPTQSCTTTPIMTFTKWPKICTRMSWDTSRYQMHFVVLLFAYCLLCPYYWILYVHS